MQRVVTGEIKMGQQIKDFTGSEYDITGKLDDILFNERTDNKDFVEIKPSSDNKLTSEGLFATFSAITSMISLAISGVKEYKPLGTILHIKLGMVLQAGSLMGQSTKLDEYYDNLLKAENELEAMESGNPEKYREWKEYKKITVP